MSEFLDLALWIFDFLVKGMLPLISGVLAIMGIYGICKRIPKAVNKMVESGASEVRDAMNGCGRNGGGRR